MICNATHEMLLMHKRYIAYLRKYSQGRGLTLWFGVGEADFRKVEEVEAFGATFSTAGILSFVGLVVDTV
jgi:hypothetical protein